MRAKNLFNNFKDYNNELEEVLETKDFSESVKSLLLSMLYKIETSYNDYKKTKVNVPEKEELIEEIINDIKINCKKIEILKPKTQEEISKKHIKIDREKGKISVYQNEKMMLESIYKISEGNFIITEKHYIASNALKDFFEKSYIVDKIEVIRDFNGWTWYRPIDEIDNLKYNLIYQNLTMILGKNFNKIVQNQRKDIIERMYVNLKREYGRAIAENVIDEFKLIITQLFYSKNSKKIKEESGKLKKERKIYVDKEKLLDELSTKKKRKFQVIHNINGILLNKKLLEKEFVERNENGEAIFSINALETKLKKEKEEIIKEINELSNQMNPKNIIEAESSLQEKSKLIDGIEKEEIDENMFIFQQSIINALEVKLKKASNKKEISELLYLIRYYNLLEYDKESLIKDNERIGAMIDKFANKVIVKAYNLKVINKVFADMNYSLKIINDLLKLKIIDIENIEFIIEKENEKYILRIYDGESLEYSKEIDELQMQGIKINKKIKVFN